MKKVLVINSGSATLKFKIFSKDGLLEEISGIVERIGISDSFLSIKTKSGEKRIDFPQGLKNHEEAFNEVAKNLDNVMPEIGLVGHRVVHGGGVYSKPQKLNDKVIAELEKFNKLAPLHNPVNLACAKAALKILPKAAQFAVFDTAFYSTIPDYAHRYALPEKYYQLGIRRYGFHGISHEYSVLRGSEKAGIKIGKSKIITCHLGSGCSITATKNGKALDTTMGFTPLEGLTMSTRAGDLDASIPLYMIDELKMTTKEIYNLLNKQSGLLGICGIMDMREILTAAGEKVVGYKSDKKYTKKQKIDCRLALDVFIYDVVRYIGQLAMSMSGMDLIVFTGGIGERSPAVRKLVLDKIKCLGKFKFAVVNADEEWMIAKEISSQK